MGRTLWGLAHSQQYDVSCVPAGRVSESGVGQAANATGLLAAQLVCIPVPMSLILPALPEQPRPCVHADNEGGGAGLCIVQERIVEAPPKCSSSAKVLAPTNKLPSLRQYGRCSLSGSGADGLRMSSEQKLNGIRLAIPLDMAPELVAEDDATAVQVERVVVQKGGEAQEVSRWSCLRSLWCECSILVACVII